MANFDEQVREFRAQVEEAQAKIAELSGRIETARAQMASRAASIDGKLQDLISKSDVIARLLQEQLETLNAQKTRVQDNLNTTLAPKIIELENKIASGADAAARTKQRVVFYDALTKSLKTARQQDVAHRINGIGVQTDQAAQSSMAAIGAATNKRMAEMMEGH